MRVGKQNFTIFAGSFNNMVADLFLQKCKIDTNPTIFAGKQEKCLELASKQQFGAKCLESASEQQFKAMK